MRSQTLRLFGPFRSTSSPLHYLRSSPPNSRIHNLSRSVSTWKPRAPMQRHNTGAIPSKAPKTDPAKLPIANPQPSVPPAATVAEVDPALAAEIPTPQSTAAGNPGGGAAAPSTAFAGAPSGDGNPGGEGESIDWSASFHGLSTLRFSPETAAILMKPLEPLDVEVKPDGIIYLPEIKYRRILNQAFGPGGWGLAPRGDLVVGGKVVSREYALVVHGRFIAQARGECQYFSEETIPTAGEGCKSNALLRCCKDLGVASELWDPRFIRVFKKEHCKEVWVEHVVTKKKRQIWVRKDTPPVYPYVIAKATS